MNPVILFDILGTKRMQKFIKPILSFFVFCNIVTAHTHTGHTGFTFA